MKLRHTLFSIVFLGPILLSACGNSATETQKIDGSTVIVTGARSAVSDSLLLIKWSPVVTRPSALLSIYTNIFLADGLAVPVSAAMTGIQAQLLLSAAPSAENMDDLYSLLEEFGAVLHVDVADLLNRSDDRAKTLDAYDIGLRNITERSARRAADLKQQIATVKAEQQQDRKTVSGLDKEVKNAVKAKDFAAAQDKQKELLTAQTALTTIQLQAQELTNLQATFADLLTIAKTRISALDSNRELLIAGLRAVDVPGVDDLGVIQSRTGKARSGTSKFNPFGGM